jgi:sulfoxide reductase heme-binding subunit YedZ
MARTSHSVLHRLFRNSRFWILLAGIILSVNIAGIIQLQVPGHTLQIIRIEQVYGFVCMALLYIAILASPLTKVFPRMPLKDAYLHARRAIGVMAFYYALLHVLISFFGQLGGFKNVGHLDHKYELSLLLGIWGLGVLFVMAATSLDWAVRTMGFHNWKLLHRLVYTASIAILIHVTLIGTHYMRHSPTFFATYGLVAVLIILEIVRIYKGLHAKEKSKEIT